MNGGLFPRKKSTGSWWRDHSLSLVVGFILIVQTVVSAWTGRSVWQAEDLPIGFWTWWWFEYTTSNVADTYGVLLVVLLTKWFYERGSAESN